MHSLAATSHTSAPATGSDTPSRSARGRAIAIDLALLFGTQAATGIIALLIFLVQTEAGRFDLGTRTASVGWAIALAAVPAWYGLLGHGSLALGGTPGQHRAGLTVEGGTVGRLVRLATHPVSVVGWWWLAVVAILGTVPGVPLLLVAAGMSVLSAGAISTILALWRPGSLPLHDRVSGTRLVSR